MIIFREMLFLDEVLKYFVVKWQIYYNFLDGVRACLIFFFIFLIFLVQVTKKFSLCIFNE